MRDTASVIVQKFGKSLIGGTVNTIPMGEYPGGLAEVIELEPDPAAPEIVFQVKHPTFGEIGVFGYEPVVYYLPIFVNGGK
jgi:hypothetical protein